MNKFVKLPLFLGITCLVCGGLLAGVVFLTEGTIQKAAEAKLAEGYRNMYNTDSVEVKNIELESTVDESIKGLAVVTHSSKQSAVYKLTSTSPYEKMTFYVGISFDNNRVDGYYSIDTNTQSIGYDQYKKNDKISSGMKGYDGSGDLVIAGVTAKYTTSGVQASIKKAFDDYNAREWGE